MKLAFDHTGDIVTAKNSSLELVTDSKCELGRFMFYTSVRRGVYTYAESFGNTIYNIIGKVNSASNLQLLQDAFDSDFITSEIFAGLNAEISVSKLSKNKVGVTIQGKGIDATWQLLSSSGRGVSLLNYNEGTQLLADQPIITDKVFVNFDAEQRNFDITSAYRECMDKNNLISLGETSFNLRVLYLASGTTEPRIINDYEYELSEGLESRSIYFKHDFADSEGRLTFQVWPTISVIHQTDNQYLKRKNRSSNPTTISNSY